MLLIPVLNPPRKPKKGRKNVAKKAKKKSKANPSPSPVRTTTRKKGKLTYVEAARASAAVYPKAYPGWHEKAGQKTGSRAGRPLSKEDALRYKRPIVGYLTRQMIREWHDPSKGGATAGSDTARLHKAAELFKTREKQLADYRKVMGTPWKRHAQKYKRGPKKGQRKKDYKIVGGKVKFRASRGPVSTVKVFRGFSPSLRTINRLVEGGFAGGLSAPGGKMKLNKPRRRKKARRSVSKNKPVRKNAKRRLKAKAVKVPQLWNKPKKRKKVRRKKAVLKNPMRKNAKRRKPAKRHKAYAYKAKKNPKRRRRVRKNAIKVKANKPRRRKARKFGMVKANKPRRRRRKARKFGMVKFSKNPMSILKGMVSDLKSAPKWITAGHILLGAGTTAAAAGFMLTRTPLARISFLQQRGVVGSLSRLALVGLTAGGISAAGALLSRLIGNPRLLRGAQTNLLIGGFAYGMANFLYEVMPGTAGMLMIPQVSAPTRVGVSGLGRYYGPDYKYGYGGMGSVESPEALVAGESLARNVNEFSGMNDWMELSGLGSSGGAPVPMEDLRGYPGQYGGGMNDWVELDSMGAMVEAGFDPGTQAF